MYITINCIRVCFNIIGKDNIVNGFICGMGVRQDVYFNNMFDMMLKLDNTLDEIGQPQATRALRAFDKKTHEAVVKRTSGYIGKPTIYHTDNEILAKHGLEATYDLLFTSRQHNSWQGKAYCEGKLVKSFESELDLGRIFLNYDEG